MGPLLVGIVLLLVVNMVLLPYVLYVLGYVGGVVLVIYGLWILFVGVRGPVTRGRRYWY